jgi:hypothetical protein
MMIMMCMINLTNIELICAHLVEIYLNLHFPCPQFYSSDIKSLYGKLSCFAR